MRIDNIVWERVPKEVKEAIAPHLKRWWPLLPTWVQDFRIQYDPTGDAGMEVTVNYCARWVLLKIPGLWLAEENEKERDTILCHEFCHIALEPVVSVTRRVIEDLSPEGSQQRELVDSVYRDGMEAAVEDLARGLGRLIAWEGRG